MPNNKDVTNRNIDLIDVIFIISVIYFVAQFGPVAVLPYGTIAFVQYAVRRTKWFNQFVDKKAPQLKITVPKEEVVLKDKTFYKDSVIPSPFEKDILEQIPARIIVDQIPDPQINLAVPIGYGTDKNKLRWIWADFSAHTIHALIAGQTGSGKDNLMRLWFMTLTKNNKPYEVQFVILDGKGEWFLPDIVGAQHMFSPPAGGINMVRNEKGKWEDKANEDIEVTIEKVMNEVHRRSQLFQQARVTSIERYREVTQLPMPYLIIFATDIGQNVKASENLNLLINVMTSKGRSLGIRMVISMQTSSKQDTFWRSNLSLIICGALQNDSQDSPVIGLPVDSILYRPSKFPSPQQRPGLFFVRDGDRQFVVQSPYLSFDSFDSYVRTLPQKYVDPFTKALLQ